jgi:hypothetical protein
MIYDFTKNNVCISGVNGDFGPLAGQNRFLYALNTKMSISQRTIVFEQFC